MLLTSGGCGHRGGGPAPKPRVNYVLGAIVSSSPRLRGRCRALYGLRPAWALEYGRFRLSSSRGNALIGHGLTAQSESGASAMLAQSERFSLRASLRIDQGDDGSDSPRRRGLPEVRSTLRARLSTGYALTPRWSVGAGVSQDILGRDGGALMSLNLGYSFPYSQQTRVSFGVGAGFADRQYLAAISACPQVRPARCLRSTRKPGFTRWTLARGRDGWP